MWFTGAGWGWWMMFGWLWMIVLWGLIIWAVYMLVSRLNSSTPGRTDSGPTALEILERRYASGELTHEQFGEMRQRLSKPGAASPTC